MVPTIRPSAKTSIFAPARCGVDPLERTIVTSAAGSPRSSAAAAAGRTSSFMTVLAPASDQDLDLRLLLQPLDEGVRVLLLLLPAEELLDPRRRFLQRHGASALVVDDLDDVVPELRGDHVADLAGLQFERH